MNQAFDTRQGVSFLKMTDAQREHLNSVRYTERHTLRDANHPSWRSRWSPLLWDYAATARGQPYAKSWRDLGYAARRRQTMARAGMLTRM
jgi:hypothetical protein